MLTQLSALAFLLGMEARAELRPPDYRESLSQRTEARADALIAEGQLDEALELVRAFCNELGRDPYMIYEEALILNLSGDARAAEKLYREVTALSPDIAAAWYDLGGLLLQRGDTEGATAALTRASELSATHKQGWAAPLQLALIAGRGGDAEAMELHLREGVRRGMRFHALSNSDEWTGFRRDPALGRVLERLIVLYGEEDLLEVWR